MRNHLIFGATLLLGAASLQASTLTAYIVATPFFPTASGYVYQLDVYAEVTGSKITEVGEDGDGGIAGFEFDIIAGGAGSPAHGTGPHIGQVLTNWDPQITGNFGTIPAVEVADGAGFDAIGASFF